MKKTRLEAFSDGVIAIIITIMVLELKIPHGDGAHPSDDIHALLPLLPVFLSYILSFIYVGIYWNNHHHMIYTVDTINGKVLWANLNLLFWLSLIPFVTAWMGETHFARWPIITYGVVLLMNAISYTILALQLVKQAGPNSALALAMGQDWKGKASIAIYAIAMAVSLYYPWVGFGLYWVVAVIWFIPDPRIEKKVAKKTTN
jgi:uncharacterized membrane protein